MAVIAPNSDLILLKVPLEIDEANQLTFANATAQYNYFNGLTGKLAVDKYTYQRKDGTIRFGANFDDIIGYNYVMYRNTSYSSKWFYAFIENMEYINDNVTAVSIKTDPYQTWMFDLSYKPCLIDREHTNDDTVGKNTLPEGLELGDFIVNGSTTNFGNYDTENYDFVNVIDVTMIQNEGESATLSYAWNQAGVSHDVNPWVNGIPSGVIHLIYNWDAQPQNYYSITDILNVYEKAGLSEAIVNVYIVPRKLIGSVYTGLTITATVGSSSVSTPSLAVPQSSLHQTSLGNSTFTKPSTIDGYTPKNGKLKTYPFMFFNVSNNAGTSQTYRYEDFSSSVKFNVEGAFTPSGSIKAIPENYKSLGTSGNALDYSITGAKYPICNWSSDSYTNWLTQNAVNMRAEMVKSVVTAGVGGLGTGFAVGGVPGAIVGGLVGAGAGLIGEARSQHLEKTRANMTPDQASGNLNSGDLTWAKYRSEFTYLPMSIKAEYARCIDEFFSQFGYKSNRVKIPNITGRRNWNYVKTVGCYIDGDVPQADLQEIKSMFDKGVTFWHNASTFGDYSQNNDII